MSSSRPRIPDTDAWGDRSSADHAAQAALKDVRSEMNRGSRVMLADVETTLRDARKHLRSVNRAVVKDLGEVQQAMRGQKTKTQRKTGPARRRAAKK